MGWPGWLRRRPPAACDPPELCSHCANPEDSTLVELGSVVEKRIFLFQCPKCGRYWGRYVHTPQICYALTPEEAIELFPEVFQPSDKTTDGTAPGREA